MPSTSSPLKSGNVDVVENHNFKVSDLENCNVSSLQESGLETSSGNNVPILDLNFDLNKAISTAQINEDGTMVIDLSALMAPNVNSHNNTDSNETSSSVTALGSSTVSDTLQPSVTNDSSLASTQQPHCSYASVIDEVLSIPKLTAKQSKGKRPSSQFPKAISGKENIKRMKEDVERKEEAKRMKEEKKKQREEKRQIKQIEKEQKQKIREEKKLAKEIHKQEHGKGSS